MRLRLMVHNHTVEALQATCLVGDLQVAGSGVMCGLFAPFASYWLEQKTGQINGFVLPQNSTVLVVGRSVLDGQVYP